MIYRVVENGTHIPNNPFDGQAESYSDKKILRCILTIKISRKTFREAFAKLNRKQDFEKYVTESFPENKIKSEISDSDSFFYIATLKGQWVGYAKLCQRTPPECVRPLPSIELCFGF